MTKCNDKMSLAESGDDEGDPSECWGQDIDYEAAPRPPGAEMLHLHTSRLPQCWGWRGGLEVITN